MNQTVHIIATGLARATSFVVLNQLKKSYIQSELSSGENFFASEARNQNLNIERSLGRTDRPETQAGELLGERAVKR